MSSTKLDILDLIPQRPPMVMVDKLESCEGVTAWSTLKVLDQNVFVEDGVLSESGMIECMAQTAAARTGFLIHSQPGAEINRIPIGVIGSIKDFKLNFYPETGDQVKVEVEVTHEFLNASVINGKVLVDGKEACRAEMKIFLTDVSIQD